MGKGTIVSETGDGLYAVELVYDRSAILGAIAKLEANIIAYQAIIDNPESSAQEVAIATIKKVSSQKRIAFLEDPDHVPQNATVNAWCLDLTTGLTGDVGTIEIARERGNGVNIQPGYSGNAVYDGARDGQLIPLMAQSPAGSYFNLAVLPGTQKWKPMFRYATITEIDYDADTCNLAISSVYSSQQNLTINQTNTLTGVSVEYMTCNASAFSVGDEVVVKFDYDWATPKVIGFKDNPQACSSEFVIQINQDYDGVVGWPDVDEFVVIEIDDTDGNYYGSIFLWGDDLSYWTLNGTVWEYQPYIDETGEAYQYKITASFDTVSQKWTIYYDDWDISGPLEAPDPAAVYYVVVNCTNCPNATQYPYRYKNADQGNTDDAVPIMALTVAVPVFRYTIAEASIISYASFAGTECDRADELIAENPIRVSTKYYDYLRGAAYSYQLIVVSSIPYKYTEYANLNSGIPILLYTLTPPLAGTYVIYCPASDWTDGDYLVGLVRLCVSVDSDVDIDVSGEELSYSATPDTVSLSIFSDFANKTATGAGGVTHTLSTEFINNVRPDLTAYYYPPDYVEGDEVSLVVLPTVDVGLYLTGRAPSAVGYSTVAPILT